jgi:hypothetical protein
MKSLRSYLFVVVSAIVLVVVARTANISHAAGQDITITAGISTNHNVQLSGNLPFPYDNSQYTWQWYSNGTTLTDAESQAANGPSLDTTTDQDADGTYCDTITVVATSLDGTDIHNGSVFVVVTWASGQATAVNVQSSCPTAGSAAPVGGTGSTGTGTTNTGTNGTGTSGSTGTTNTGTSGTSGTSSSTGTPITTSTCSSGSSSTDTSICNPTGITDLTALIVSIIKYMLGIIGILAVLMIIYGGYQMVVSAGNADLQKKGKQTMIYAVLGLVLAVLSYSIVSIVENVVRSQGTTQTTTSSALFSEASSNND